MKREQEQDLRDLVRARLIPGFVTLDDLQTDVADWAYEVGIDPREGFIVAREIWERHHAEEAYWPDTGDFGLLSAAFDDLEAAGILARMNFSCCAGCAATEILDERLPNDDPSDWYHYREWAYVYFHQQDAECLAEPYPSLCLGFGAFRPHPSFPVETLAALSDEATLDRIHADTETMLGQQIVDVLRRHGLAVTWSGHRSERIVVSIRSWRKPLP